MIEVCVCVMVCVCVCVCERERERDREIVVGRKYLTNFFPVPLIRETATTLPNLQGVPMPANYVAVLDNRKL